MASTVYYGKSTTAANVRAKVVILNETSFNENTLKSGDLLVVLFAQANTVGEPTLVLDIADSNHSRTSDNDTGTPIYDSVGTAVGNKAWNAGETVIFTYTALATESQVPGENYGWFMLGEPVATADKYGVVTIGNLRDNNSAVSLSQLNNMLNAYEGNTLSYAGITPEQDNAVGILCLNNNGQEISRVTITIPNFLTESDLPTMPDLPTLTSQLTNDGSNAGDDKTYLESGDNITVGTITSGAITSSGKVKGNKLESADTLKVDGISTLTGQLKANGGISTTDLSASGTITVNGTLNVPGNTKKISARYDSYEVRFNKNGEVQRMNLKQYIKKVIGDVLDDDDDINTTDTFSLDSVYSKNLVYPAGSAVPSGTRALSVSGITASTTTHSGTVVKVEIPNKTGYKTIAVVGYNVTEESQYEDSSAPSKMNVYQCRHQKDNGVHYARCQMRNMNTEQNIIYISFQVLYQKTS